jgi:hypothetical protein
VQDGERPAGRPAVAAAGLSGRVERSGFLDADQATGVVVGVGLGVLRSVFVDVDRPLGTARRIEGRRDSPGSVIDTTRPGS